LGSSGSFDCAGLTSGFAQDDSSKINAGILRVAQDDTCSNTTAGSFDRLRTGSSTALLTV